jgi:SEC-C motif-containing protein
MRSRYSAFAVRDEAYLVRTWHPDTRPGRVTLDPGQEWTGLTILATSGGGLFDQHGTVEFQARYVLDGRPGRIRENSAFVRYQKVWVYFGPHLP